MGEPFDIGVDEGDGSVVVSLRGDLDLATADRVRAAVAAALGRGDDVTIDLSSLEFIDSTGLEVLLRSSRLARDGGQEFRLENAGHRVQRTLVMAGMETLLG